MRIYTGDRVIDHKGRELELAERATVAGRKGWLAHPVRKEEAQREHCAIVLDTEITAVVGDNGQYLLR